MRERVATIVMLVLLLLAILYAYQNLERVPHARHGQTPSSPYAAALALLEHWNLKTRRVTSSAQLFPLPDTDVVLVLERSNALIQPWQQEALLDWIARGGTLVTHALPLNFDRWQDDVLSVAEIVNHDPLLYAAGITAWQRSTDAKRSPVSRHAGIASEELSRYLRFYCQVGPNLNSCIKFLCGNDETVLVFTRINTDMDEHWQLDLSPDIDLYHRDLFEHIDEGNPALPDTNSRVQGRGRADNHDTLLKIGLGNGTLWVLADLDIFSQARIYHLDHAALLQRLTAGASQVWWTASIEVPPLSLWLWLHGWPLVCTALLMLVLFLWRHMPRRGVILRDTAQTHQDFTEHLRASSALLWRLHLKRPLLETLRHDVQRRLARHAGGSDRDTLRALAATLSGLDAAQIDQALDSLPENDDSLRDTVMLLQQLRQQL